MYKACQSITVSNPIRQEETNSMNMTEISISSIRDIHIWRYVVLNISHVFFIKLYSIKQFQKVSCKFIVKIKLIYSSIWREIKYRIKLLFISSLICNEETLYLLKLQRCKKIEDVRYNFEKRKLLQYIMVTHQ